MEVENVRRIGKGEDDDNEEVPTFSSAPPVRKEVASDGLGQSSLWQARLVIRAYPLQDWPHVRLSDLFELSIFNVIGLR